MVQVERETSFFIGRFPCKRLGGRLAALTAVYVRRRDGAVKTQCQGCGYEVYVTREHAEWLRREWREKQGVSEK